MPLVQHAEGLGKSKVYVVEEENRKGEKEKRKTTDKENIKR